MKILHLCLSCFYIDGYNYQENVLPRINKEQGHEVHIIASCETFIDNACLGFVEPQSYTNEWGIPVERIPFVKGLSAGICKKVGLYQDVYAKIDQIEPDVILHHGCAGKSLLTIKKYKQSHPHVKIYIDSHADFNNSGRNFISKYLLHKIINRYFLQKVMPFTEKVLPITPETKDFLVECGKIPEEKLEIFPLGGTVLADEQYEASRQKRRSELGLQQDDVLLLHSGKLDALKKTKDILLALQQVPDLKATLVIIGSIPEDMRDTLCSLIEKDKRVVYLGWKSGEELQEYLCACDIYIQPGSQSATMQNAMCLNNALVLYPHKSHTDFLDCDIAYVKDEKDIESFFRAIQQQPQRVQQMKESNFAFAKERLDYEKIASRIYR